MTRASLVAQLQALEQEIRHSALSAKYDEGVDSMPLEEVLGFASTLAALLASVEGSPDPTKPRCVNCGQEISLTHTCFPILAARAEGPTPPAADADLRYCNCADPENCRQPIEGRICRPRTHLEAAPPKSPMITSPPAEKANDSPSTSCLLAPPAPQDQP